MRVLSRRTTVLPGSPVRQPRAARRRRLRLPDWLRLGLGDAVEIVAKPIAREIDRFNADLGLKVGKLAGCGACSRRRRFLNVVVPGLASWTAWTGAAGRVRGAWRMVYGRPRRGGPSISSRNRA